MRDLAAVRRHSREIDDHRIRVARANLPDREQAVAEIKGGLKAKGLELLAPLEALVFVPMNQPDRLHDP